MRLREFPAGRIVFFLGGAWMQIRIGDAILVREIEDGPLVPAVVTAVHGMSSTPDGFAGQFEALHEALGRTHACRVEDEGRMWFLSRLASDSCVPHGAAKGFLKAGDDAAAAVAFAPRVSLADVDAFISEEHHFTAKEALMALGCPQPERGDDPTRRLSICLLVLKNGFCIVGKSAPASAANFNPDLGRKLARDDAIRQAWPLMGFALASKLRGI